MSAIDRLNLRRIDACNLSKRDLILQQIDFYEIISNKSYICCCLENYWSLEPVSLLVGGSAGYGLLDVLNLKLMQSGSSDGC